MCLVVAMFAWQATLALWRQYRHAPPNLYVVINLRERPEAAAATIVRRVRHKYCDWLNYRRRQGHVLRKRELTTAMDQRRSRSEGVAAQFQKSSSSICMCSEWSAMRLSRSAGQASGFMVIRASGFDQRVDDGGGAAAFIRDDAMMPEVWDVRLRFSIHFIRSWGRPRWSSAISFMTALGI